MIVLAGVVLGGLWGGLTARKRGGNHRDIAQYATVHAIIWGIVGLFATIALERML